jgi:hypothetical protein
MLCFKGKLIMKIKGITGWIIPVLGVLLVAGASAQPPGGPWGRPGGMRDNPKMRLGRFMRGVGLLEKQGKARLSAAQAKKIVTAISPWRNKSSMSEAQAKQLETRLGSVLTSTQKKELQALRPPRREGGDHRAERNGERDGERRGDGAGGHRRGGWDGHRGGPDGRGPRDGKPPTDAQRKEMRQRMDKMRTFFQTYNPFYPPTKYQTVKGMPGRMQEGLTRRYAAQQTLLVALSKKAAKA